MATVTALSKNTVMASCPQQEWVINNLSALKEVLLLPEFVVEGVSWCVKLEPASNQNIPGIFLRRLTELSLSTRVKFAVKMVDRKSESKSYKYEFDKILDSKSSVWGWSALTWPKAEPTPSGLIMDDKLVLQTHLWVVKDLSPGFVDGPLLEESHDFLARACLRLYRGKDTSQADVMLKVEDDKLPAHRALLAESSDVFKAMFQSGMSESESEVVEIQEIAAEDMKIILKYIYGMLDSLPEGRLHHLILAADRLQMTLLMEQCVSHLQRHLSMDTFAETALCADRVSHQGLHEACVEFALQEKDRALKIASVGIRSSSQAMAIKPALEEHEGLKRIIVEAPDLALRLMKDILKQSVPKTVGKD